MLNRNSVSPLRIGIAAALTALFLAFAGGGCGSDDSSDEAELTKQQFIKRADAICAEARDRLPKEFEDYARAHDIRSFEDMSKVEFKEGVEATGAPALRKQNAALEDLGTPKGDEGETAEFLQTYEEAVDAGEEDYQVLLEKQAGPFADVAVMAKKYGFSICGQTP